MIVGDVFFNNNILTTRRGLRQPARIFTVDPARNRQSMRRLIDLDPDVRGLRPRAADPRRRSEAEGLSRQPGVGLGQRGSRDSEGPIGILKDLIAVEELRALGRLSHERGS